MAINTTEFELKAQCEEWIALKGGIALNNSDMRKYVPESYKEIWASSLNNPLRIYSEEIQEIFESTAINLGIFEKRPSLSTTSFLRRLCEKDDSDNILDSLAVLVECMEIERKEIMEPEGKKIYTLKKYFDSQSYKSLSTIEKASVFDFIDLLDFRTTNGIWSDTKIYTDIIELEDLFTQYETIAPDGHFFDQRFIKYLNKQFEDIDNIHWRKFEELTAEFFLKHGYEVELGNGTKDGGIDIRVWSDAKDPNTLRIVQCKRWKNPVNIEYVKALAYDVVDHNAQGGFIVTTNSIAPGAEQLTAVRNRQVIGVERDNLNKWLKIMRAPDLGSFVGSFKK